MMPPSNPSEAEESGSESTLERGQSEIEEKQRALSARKAKRQKERMTSQKAAEKEAAEKRNRDTAEYLENEGGRHSGSEDSSQHRIPSTGCARNRARTDIPRERVRSEDIDRR